MDWHETERRTTFGDEPSVSGLRSENVHVQRAKINIARHWLVLSIFLARYSRCIFRSRPAKTFVHKKKKNMSCSPSNKGWKISVIFHETINGGVPFSNFNSRVKGSFSVQRRVKPVAVPTKDRQPSTLLVITSQLWWLEDNRENVLFHSQFGSQHGW